jgi:hypothetical protein
VIPAGMGVRYKQGNLMFDARAVFRATTTFEMFAGPEAALDSWSATARVGFEY